MKHFVLLLLLISFGYSEDNSLMTMPDIPESLNSFLSDPSFFLPLSPPSPKLDTIIEDTETGHFLHFLVQAKIGEPEQILKLKLSTAFCGLYVFNKDFFETGYSFHDSSTFHSTSYTDSISNVSGHVVQDTFQFSTYNLLAYKFLFINKGPVEKKTYDGALGFGYNCDKTDSLISSDVLIDLLKESATYIKVFWYRLNRDLTGLFSPGAYPKQVLDDPKHYKTINLLDNQKSSQWVFNVYLIYFDDGETFFAKAPFSFGIDGNFFSVCQNFFEWLMDKYFKEETSNGICQISSGEIVELYCNSDYDYRTKLPAIISIVVGKWSLKIKTEELFKIANKNSITKLWFGILYYPKKDQYYISQSLLGPSITVYDREKKQIGVYNIKLIE